MPGNKQSYQAICEDLKKSPKTFLVTGGAGFIGSHICEELLTLGQCVHILDNLSTGCRSNIEKLKIIARKFDGQIVFFEGDIKDRSDVLKATLGVDYVCHQAALGSVPASIKDPVETHDVNVTGFINVLNSAKNNNVQGFVYASSSAIYGDVDACPQSETKIGHALSPYAVSKKMNESYAEIFATCYDFKAVGLRYFNVFGPRQMIDGPYAAVIPKWIDVLKSGDACVIFGDGKTTRDFVFVKDVVQANILALFNHKAGALVCNIGLGVQTSLNNLEEILRNSVIASAGISCPKAIYKDFRQGDIQYSMANIERAKSTLLYVPVFSIAEGLKKTVDYFVSKE